MTRMTAPTTSTGNQQNESFQMSFIHKSTYPQACGDNLHLFEVGSRTGDRRGEQVEKGAKIHGEIKMFLSICMWAFPFLDSPFILYNVLSHSCGWAAAVCASFVGLLKSIWGAPIEWAAAVTHTHALHAYGDADDIHSSFIISFRGFFLLLFALAASRPCRRREFAWSKSADAKHFYAIFMTLHICIFCCYLAVIYWQLSCRAPLSPPASQ